MTCRAPNENSRKGKKKEIWLITLLGKRSSGQRKKRAIILSQGKRKKKGRAPNCFLTLSFKKCLLERGEKGGLLWKKRPCRVFALAAFSQIGGGKGEKGRGGHVPATKISSESGNPRKKKKRKGHGAPEAISGRRRGKGGFPRGEKETKSPSRERCCLRAGGESKKRMLRGRGKDIFPTKRKAIRKKTSLSVGGKGVRLEGGVVCSGGKKGSKKASLHSRKREKTMCRCPQVRKKRGKQGKRSSPEKRTTGTPGVTTGLLRISLPNSFKVSFFGRPMFAPERRVLLRGEGEQTWGEGPPAY